MGSTDTLLQVLIAVVGVFSSIIIFLITRKDNKDKDIRVEVKDNIKSVETQMEKQIQSLSSDLRSQGVRIRQLEGTQITEEKVKILLKERIEPIERGMEQVEMDMKQSYKDLSMELKSVSMEFSSELRASQRNLQDAIMVLSDNISYIRGKLEASDHAGN